MDFLDLVSGSSYFHGTGSNGREWQGGVHADDGSRCLHGVPDEQAALPRHPGDGYTCRVSGRPLLFAWDDGFEATADPAVLADRARVLAVLSLEEAAPRFWPPAAAAVACLTAALGIVGVMLAVPGAPAWAALIVLALLGGAIWTGIEAGRRA